MGEGDGCHYDTKQITMSKLQIGADMSGLRGHAFIFFAHASPSVCYDMSSSFLWAANCPLCFVQGHFQIMFSWRHCPMLQRNLSIFMRIMYMSGVWSYIVGAISTPLFMLIPMVSVQLPAGCIQGYFVPRYCACSCHLRLPLRHYCAAHHLVRHLSHHHKLVDGIGAHHLYGSEFIWPNS